MLNARSYVAGTYTINADISGQEEHDCTYSIDVFDPSKVEVSTLKTHISGQSCSFEGKWSDDYYKVVF